MRTAILVLQVALIALCLFGLVPAERPLAHEASASIERSQG